MQVLMEATVREVAEAAKSASRQLVALTEGERNAALESMALALSASEDRLLEANRKDIEAAERPGGERLAPATLSRLKLNGPKLAEMIEQVRAVGSLPDPLARTLERIELDNRNPPAAETLPDPEAGRPGLHLEKISVPLGVLAVIFEARPDAVTQIAALAIKSGNAVILKPGREVEHTAEALVHVLRAALALAGLPKDAITLVLGRERVAELLEMDKLVDMVIPRGSKALVEYVQANTRIPVLGHAEGVCHVYVDKAADQAMALRIIEDAKLDYPAACNAVETVLVHRAIAPEFLPQLGRDLARRNVVLHADGEAGEWLGSQAQEVADWHTEYGGAEVAVGVVDSLQAAVEHIHRFGSLHTECIVTEDAQAAALFLREVDAAGVFHNASTRFADGFRYGFGAEVGISTSKFHARGPVGLDGLTTYKYLLRGHGHIAGEYRGPEARNFTHRRERV